MPVTVVWTVAACSWPTVSAAANSAAMNAFIILTSSGRRNRIQARLRRVIRNMKRAFALLLGLALFSPAAASAAPLQRVVLAGGCFWGMQAVFEPLRGVSKAVAGYSGGSALTAHYDIVSTGMTGHAESVEVTYDPAQISFKQLLDVYFLVAHDPTELNRQGPDDGTQYRSEIFFTTTAQRNEATAYIKHLTGAKVYSAPIVTKLEPLRA